MALRTINYSVTKTEILPKTIQNGGIQGDLNITNVIFTLSTDLVTALSAEVGDTHTLGYRVDATDSAGGYHPSELLVINLIDNTISYSLPHELTSIYGVCKLHLIVTLLNNENVEEKILFSSVALIKIHASALNSSAEIEVNREITGAMKEAIAARAGAEAAAETAMQKAMESSGCATSASVSQAACSGFAATANTKSSEAAAFCAAASQSATVASTAATNSANFATTAEASASSSANSCVEAETFATNAAASATAAAGASTSASAFSNSAANSATAAATAATTVVTAHNSSPTAHSDLREIITLSATNLITNGDFSNGIVGWTPYVQSLSAANNVLTCTGNGVAAEPIVRGNSSIAINPAHKYYARASIKVTNSVCAFILLAYEGSGGGTKQVYSRSTPAQNTVYTISIVDIPSVGATGNFNLFIRHGYADAATANGKVMEIQYATVIDLTATFGAGNEPTAAQMDSMLSNFNNCWFSGTVNLFNSKIVTNKLALLENLKADKAQEAWISPTLLNGATTDPTNPVMYRKNTLGLVEFKGKATITGGAITITMPAGYRLLTTSEKRFPIIVGSSSFGTATIISYNVYLSVGVVDFSNIRYYAEA